jgi:hypothetical protein
MSSPTLLRRAFDKYQREGLYSVIHESYEYIRKLIFGKYLFKTITGMRYRTQQYFYDAPAHPYKIINICPDQVKYFNEAIDPRWGLGIIKNGEWDSPANCTPIHNSTHYRGLKQHFEEGLDWENTVYYRERIQNDRSQSVMNHRKERLE